MSSGRFYGIGVGPGDPEMLTLKARRILSQAAVVFVPQAGPSEESFAYSIVKGFLDESRQKVIPLLFPMTKDESKLEKAWKTAAGQIHETIMEGKDCAFITEGDPLLYSTFIYIYEILRETFPKVVIEIIPGISSIFAAAARAKEPLALGDDCMAIIPATSEVSRILDALKSFETVVFTKIDRSFDKLLAALEEAALVDKAIWVKKCTTGEEEIVRDIRKLKGRKIDYMSLLIVRKIP